MKALEFYQVVSGLSIPTTELGNKDFTDAKHKEKATKYVEEVVKLLSFVNSKKDTNAPFNIADLQKLMSRISNARIALKNLKGVVDDKMIDNNSKQIAEIEKVVALLDATKNMSLTEAINSTEVNNVELWGDAQRTGGYSNSRSRITVTNSKNEKVNGYFTSDYVLFDESINKRIDAEFKAAIAKYPNNGAIKSLYKKLRASEYGMLALVDCMRDDDEKNRLRNATVDTANVGSCYSQYKMRMHGFLGRMTDIDRLGRNAELKELLIKLRTFFDNSEVKSQRANFYQYGPHKGVGIKAVAGSSKSGRNVAVSNVANILGIPHLVAKAVPITVNDNGKLVRGVFMEQAKGLDFDLKHPERTDFMKLRNNSLGGDALKQLADLQVLDFICQNVDRHFKNILYTIDHNGDITKIQGIDNDLSFGTIKPVNTLTVQNGTALYDITVITQSMADTLKRLQPETLASVLAGTGLKDEEIKAACERLTMLKSHIEKRPNNSRNIKAGKVKIPTDREWMNISSSELARERTHINSFREDLQKLDNLYTRVNSMVNSSVFRKRHIYGGRTQAYNAAKAQNFGLEPAEAKEVFAETEKTNVLTKEAVAKNNNILTQHSRELMGFRRAENIATPGYVELQKALSDVITFKYEPEYKNVNPVARLRTDREFEEVRAAEERMRWLYHSRLLNLKQIAEEYVNDNTESVATGSNINSQVSVAREILDFVTTTEETFREATLQQQEDELEEIHLQLIKEQHQFDTIVGALAVAISDKLAPLDCNNAIDKILDGPIIKLMMEKYEALEDLSKLAETKPEELYQGYAALVAAKGKDDFKDEMHKALLDKVLADYEKEGKKVDVPQPAKEEPQKVEEVKQPVVAPVVEPKVNEEVAPEAEEVAPEAIPEADEDLALNYAYQEDLKDVMDLKALKEYSKETFDYYKSEYTKKLKEIEKEFSTKASSEEAVRERYAKYFLIRDVIKQHEELKNQVMDYDISKVDEKTGKEYYSAVNESMHLLYDKTVILDYKVKLIEAYQSEALGIKAFRKAVNLLVNNDLFEKAMQKRNPLAKDEEIYNDMYDIYQQKLENLKPVAVAEAADNIQDAPIDENVQLNEYENIEEYDNVEDYDEAMADQGIIGNHPDYVKLTSTFTSSMEAIKKQASEIKEGKMDTMLFARYVTNRIALAEVEEHKLDDVNEFTLSELQRYTENVNHMYDNTLKLIEEKSELLNAAVEKFTGAKNYGDVLDKMYTAYAEAVINNKKKPEPVEVQNSKEVSEQEAVKTETKKTEEKHSMSLK